ncbi:MAG: dipeptide-binding transporter, partial [Actinomycetia bacterium]|nr:dipeptide-binding transporter [Actinomycetes bacterium]
VAKSYAYSTAKDTLTLKLRADVKFHDGTPVDSAAVKASLNRGLTLPGSTVKAQLAPITAIDTPDASTVVLHLAPNQGAGLARALGTNAGAIINPAVIAAGTDLGLAPPANAGSGPYLLQSLVPTQKFTFVRAPGKYWDASRGRAARIENTILVTDTDRVNAVQTGQSDITYVTTGAAAANEKTIAAASGGSLKFLNHQINTTWSLIFNPTNTDLNLRRSLQASVDRDAIIKSLLPGVCVASHTLIPKTGEGYSPSTAAKFNQKPNPAKAKQLMSKAQNKNVSILTVATHDFLNPMAQLTQQLLKDAGAGNVTIEGLPSTGLLNARINASQNYELEANATFPAVDAVSVFRQTLLSGPKAYPADQLATLNAQMAQLDDPATTAAQRQKIYDSINTAVLDQATIIPLCTIANPYLYNAKIVGIQQMAWLWYGNFDPSTLAITK